MPFSAVIFDLDGVIADTESVQLRAINMLLNPFGISISADEWAGQYVGHPIEEDVRDLHARLNLSMPLATLAERRRAVYRELLRKDSQLQPQPGLVSLLDELHARKIPIGIASGSPLGDVETVLRVLGLSGRFNAIAAGDQVEHPKPAPDVYLLAAARLEIQPDQCVAIEDSAAGVAAAKAAGARVVAIPSIYTRRQDLSRADAVLRDFDELKYWLFETTA